MIIYFEETKENTVNFKEDSSFDERIEIIQ
jgi:hypothetical protein